MGFDTTWLLVDVNAYRADPTRSATVGEVWRRARDGAPWASEVALPDRNDIGLLMALCAVARANPTYQRVANCDRSVYEAGAPFAGATHHDKNAIEGALQPFERPLYASKEKALVLKALKVKAGGAPTLLVGAKKLAAVSRWAAIFDEHLALHEEAWVAATKFVERPTFAAFLPILSGLPADRILMSSTV
jgi:hypothetical protein